MQSNCKNNDVINGLKQRKGKKHAKQLYMVNKRQQGDGGEWLIGAHTQNISYLSTVTTQHKSRQRPVKAPIDEGKGTWTSRRLRRVLTMGKACRRVSVLVKARRLEGEQL